MQTILNVDALNKTDLTLITGTRVFLDGTWKSDMFSSPYSRLYFVNDGDGYIKTEDETVPLKAGNVYLIPAELTFSYGCTYLEKIFFHISLTTLEKYDLFSKTDKVLSMPYSSSEYDRLAELLKADSYESLLQLKALLLKTVTEFLLRQNTSTPVKRYGELVRNIIAYVHENTRVNLYVKDISERLFVSESKIRNTFLKETGITVGKYIDDMIFIKAKQLLHKEQLSIAEISVELGFCDQFYFSRRFKEKFGETPSSFRKKKPEEFI